MNPAAHLLDNSYAFVLDAVNVAISIFTLSLALRSNLKIYSQWLIWVVVGHVFALLYRTCHIIAQSVVPYPTLVILLWLDQGFIILDIISTVLSVAIMLRLFKGIADRYRQEQAYQQSATPLEHGTWPPPPT